MSQVERVVAPPLATPRNHVTLTPVAHASQVVATWLRPFRFAL
jgi:hypothetical protein